MSCPQNYEASQAKGLKPAHSDAYGSSHAAAFEENTLKRVDSRAGRCLGFEEQGDI
jgi:hypothetical protein